MAYSYKQGGSIKENEEEGKIGREERRREREERRREKLVVGVPLVLCIGDNASFCCGGRCTLVERHYALVICSVGQIFQNMLF